MKKQIYGVVLAAGLSQRMGTPKQLLPFGEKTILQTVVDVLLGLDLTDVIVVLGHQADQIQETLKDRSVTCCMNSAYQEGMFASVLCGVDNIPLSADGMLLALGDQPHIDPKVGKAVVDAYQKDAAGIVIPTVGGKRGHPVVIDLKRYRAEIKSLSGEAGLKPFMRGHGDDTFELRVEDAGILRDLDTPEDYQAELENRRIDDQ